MSARPARPVTRPTRTPPVGDGVRFEALAREYLAWSRLHHTASTHRTRRDLVQSKLVPCLGRMRARDIGPRDVEALLAAHARLSPASRNRIVSALSSVLRYGRRLGHLRRNVALRVPRAREEVTALPLVSLAEQDALLASLPEARRLLFLTALDSGARLGELLRLRWADLDEAREALLVRRSKSGRPRLVRLSTRLRLALASAAARRRREGSGEELLFADAVGSTGELRWSWRQSFKRAARAAGHPRLRIHDLRHMAAINLVRAGVDLPTVQAHLGHRHLISTLRYAAYADETASGRAARALDRLHGQIPGQGPRSQAPS